MAEPTDLDDHRSTGGFTLIEVLIAFTLLAIGVLAISAMQLTASRNAAQADVRAMALAVAQQRVEMARSADPVVDLVESATTGSFDSLCDCSPSGTCPNPASYGAATYAISCTYATVCEGTGCPPDPYSRQFTITVRAGSSLTDTTFMSNSIILTGKVVIP